MIGLAKWFKNQPCRFILGRVDHALKRGVYEVSITSVEVYNDEIVVNLGNVRPVVELEDA